jgi:4-amino-4-deoxy-L-arabinose transferase-like glycosyltransferase
MARAETSHGPAETLPNERDGLLSHAGGAAITAVVLLALALRLYRLNDQSLWFDDFITFGHLRAPDLQSYLRLLRVEIPEHGAAPLYYVIQYCFGKWIGMNAEALRLLSVAFAVSAVPLLYGFVRCLCGRKAALLAALCLALSPQHVWYAQELRQYELITPLVIISAWTFMLGYRENRPIWWAVNLIANTLLAWTHLLTVILILTEGLFLLAFSIRRFRRVVAWSAVQLLLLAPSVVSVLRMSFSNHYIAVDAPTPWQVFTFILGGDIVMLHSDLMPAGKTHGADFAAFPSLFPLRFWLSLALLAVFTGSAAWAVVRLIRRLRLQRRAQTPDANPPRASRCETENTAFLLLLLLVPGLTVALLGISLHTFIYANYCMYNQMALYAIVGAALMALPGMLLRRGAVLVVAVLFTFQLLLLLPEVTRADWKGASAHIRSNASSKDVVIDIQHFYPDRELGFYLSPDWPVRLVETFQAACDDSARILQTIPGTAPDSGRERVWIVFQQWFLDVATGGRFKGVAVLEQALRERGLKPSFKEFPGHLDVVVCMVERSGVPVCCIGSPVQQLQPLPIVFGGAPLRPIDYDAVLDELGFQGCDQDRRRRLLAELRESVAHWPVDERFPVSTRLGCVWPVLDLASRGHCDLAEALSRHLIARYPDFGVLHMALGAALLKERQIPAAQAAFAAAGKLHRDLGDVLAPFLAALARNDDPDAVCNEARRLEQCGFWFAPALRAVCRSDGPSADPLPATQTLSIDGPVDRNGSIEK